MSQDINARMLGGFSPLDALSPENLKEVAGKAQEVHIKAGRNLFRAGDSTSAQWFLAEGTVELTEADDGTKRVEAGSPDASVALEAGNPARRSAVARTDCKIYKIDRSLLDMMLTWDQTGNFSVTELNGETDEGGDDWMVRMLQTQAFRRIPPANIQAIFMRMEPVACRAGEEIIRQGDAGDYFYIVRDGRCEVTRTSKGRAEGIRLAELGPGDGFGEEALISDNPRNATVRMTVDGTVMRLSKADFHELLNEPLQQWVDFEEAVERVSKGARWLDVRLPPEFQAGHIKGARNLPLVFLRMKARQLEDVEYIVYCDTGSRSSAGAYLLTERGFAARVLRGGLDQVPPTALDEGTVSPD